MTSLGLLARLFVLSGLFFEAIADPDSGPRGCGCQSAQLCPTREGFIERNMAFPMSCRMCLTEACSSIDMDNLAEYGNCIADAQSTCYTCPPFTQMERNRLGRCTDCVRQCNNEQDSQSAPSSCEKHCQRPYYCPTPTQIIHRINRDNRECRNCIMEECGRPNNANIVEVARCMYDARADCDECTLSATANTQRINCMSCLSRCSQRQVANMPTTTPTMTSSPPTPSTRPTPSPETPSGRMCSCHSPSMCHSPQEERGKMNRETNECRTCVQQICGGGSHGNHSRWPGCITQARDHCFACESLNTEDEERMLNCRRCARRCFPLTTDPFVTFRPTDCRRYCTQHPRPCPSADQVIHTIRSPATSPPCRSCIMTTCGLLNNINKIQVADCMFQARANCDVCTLNDRARDQRMRCASCMTDCAERQAVSTTTAATATTTTATSRANESTPFIVFG